MRLSKFLSPTPGELSNHETSLRPRHTSYARRVSCARTGLISMRGQVQNQHFPSNTFAKILPHMVINGRLKHYILW